MKQDEIIELAKQAGFERLGHTDSDWVCYPEDIERFAKLVAEAEREECAKILDANAMACESPIWRSLLQSNAQAIRARGQS